MLTYDSLRKIVTDEKGSHTLVNLPDNFFAQAKSYLEGKESIHKEDKWEIDSAKRFLKDLLELRERKLVNAALYFVRSQVIPKNMMKDEKIFFEKIVDVLKDFNKNRETPAKETEPVPAKEVGKVEILQEIPEFVGTDLKNYGPLKKGDVVSLPDKIAALLIEKRAAKAFK